MGRKQTTIMLALLCCALSFTSARAALPEGDDETDQAATFAIRAIAQAGLLDPLGQYYGYDGIVEYDDRWVISFRSSTCYRNEEIETCDPNTGTRENPHDDAWLEIEVSDGMFVITDAFGRFTEEQDADLRAYTEPATIEQTHLEFPTVRVDRSLHEQGYDIRAAMLWAGPLYVPGVWSVCTPEIYDAEGTVLWSGSHIAFDTRPGEYFRSNGLFGTGAVELEVDPAAADMICELWTQETWVIRTEPSIDRAGGAVEVTTPLVWKHEDIVSLDSRCRVELLSKDGATVKAKNVAGPTSPWGGRADKTKLFTRFRVAQPKEVSSASVRCLAKGQSLSG